MAPMHIVIFMIHILWVNSHENQETIFKLINQIPPNYIDLNNSVNFKEVMDTGIDYKGVVFWSHWDEAESKMSNFLTDFLTITEFLTMIK